MRSYPGWYRHVTLVMLAAAYLTGICATSSDTASVLVASPNSSPAAALALSLPEVRHLLARLAWPSSYQVTQLLAWSWWRRCHQGWASYYHRRRRLEVS